MTVTHRTNQGRFNGSNRTGLEVERRRELALDNEDDDRRAALKAAVYLPPVPTMDELKSTYLSAEALQWKREHPGQLRP